MFDNYEHFYRFKLDNIKRLFWVALVIFPAMSFSDYSLGKESHSFWFFLGLRAAFLIPYILIFASYKHLKPKHVDYYGLIIFLSFAMGASVPSYFFGGISSDYYFGIIIISFVQFISLPLRTGMAFVVEAIYMLIYFPLNIMPFDHDSVLILKQFSNYLSFAFIKIAVSERFYSQLLSSFKTIDLNRKLEKKESLQMIFGELCHLLNNPLFISTSLIKRIRKKDEYKEDSDLKKVIDANQRMQDILHEMLKVQSEDEFNIEDNKILKEFFKDTDVSTKARKQ